MTTLRGKAIVSRVPSRLMFAVTSLLRLRGLNSDIAVNCGLRDGGLKGGNVVGITRGCFSSRRVDHLSIMTPGMVLGVVHGFSMMRGGRMLVPGRLRKVMQYNGPGYVAGGRPVPARFRMIGGRRNVLGYRCYRGRRGGDRIGLM